MGISVLLSTYNGEKYLNQQLDSLFSQTYEIFEIIARDDGSQDKTLEILRSYNIKIIDSKENLGAKGSFGALLEYAVQNNASEYFMFCDQDDVWDSNKIEKTLAKMHDIEKSLPDSPILVNTDLKVVDEELKVLDNSMWNYQQINPKLNTLNRLLIQNTITGCTVMINKKLAQISLQIPDEALMHDWWIGLVASKFGRIEYIHDSTIQYRQHTGNNVGAKRFSYVNIIKNILKKRFSIFFNGNLHKKHLAKNIEQARAFLSIYKENLGEVDIQVLEDLATIESKSFWQKRKILLRHKLLKQGLINNILLFLRI